MATLENPGHSVFGYGFSMFLTGNEPFLIQKTKDQVKTNIEFGISIEI